MKNKVYVFYNNLSGRYGEVVAFPSDGFAVARVQPTIQKDQLEEVQLCRIGSIDVETGELKTEPPVRIAWRVSEERLPVSQSEKISDPV